MLLKCGLHFSISFVGTHFHIFVCTFLVHLHTVYAYPQKLVQRLNILRLFSLFFFQFFFFLLLTCEHYYLSLCMCIVIPLNVNSNTYKYKQHLISFPTAGKHNSCGHTTEFYLGKNGLPRGNLPRVTLGKHISGFNFPRREVTLVNLTWGWPLWFRDVHVLEFHPAFVLLEP